MKMTKVMIIGLLLLVTLYSCSKIKKSQITCELNSTSAMGFKVHVATFHPKIAYDLTQEEQKMLNDEDKKGGKEEYSAMWSCLVHSEDASSWCECQSGSDRDFEDTMTKSNSNKLRWITR